MDLERIGQILNLLIQDEHGDAVADELREFLYERSIAAQASRDLETNAKQFTYNKWWWVVDYSRKEE